MKSDDVDEYACSIDEELSSPSPGRDGNARQRGDLAQLSKENVRLAWCQCFSERQAVDNQTGRIVRLIMAREMASALTLGTKKHADKSVVCVADAKANSRTRTHECQTDNSMKKCVCRESAGNRQAGRNHGCDSLALPQNCHGQCLERQKREVMV